MVSKFILIRINSLFVSTHFVVQKKVLLLIVTISFVCWNVDFLNCHFVDLIFQRADLLWYPGVGWGFQRIEFHCLLSVDWISFQRFGCSHPLISYFHLAYLSLPPIFHFDLRLGFFAACSTSFALVSTTFFRASLLF